MSYILYVAYKISFYKKGHLWTRYYMLHAFHLANQLWLDVFLLLTVNMRDRGGEAVVGVMGVVGGRAGAP